MKRLNNYFFGVDEICFSDAFLFYGVHGGGLLFALILVIDMMVRF